MKLIMTAASPYVRKVRVCLVELGLGGSVTEVPVTTTPLDTAADVVAANPLGKIPALIRDDGPTLYDSRVICRYLDDLGQGGLYPESRIWEILTLEATADGILDAAVAMVYEARFKSTTGKSADWIEAQWVKVTRALHAVETLWMSHLSGPVTIGQIGMGCALGYLDFRHPARDWRSDVPALAAWEAEFAQRPAMEATRPD